MRTRAVAAALLGLLIAGCIDGRGEPRAPSPSSTESGAAANPSPDPSGTTGAADGRPTASVAIDMAIAALGDYVEPEGVSLARYAACSEVDAPLGFDVVVGTLVNVELEDPASLAALLGDPERTPAGRWRVTLDDTGYVTVIVHGDGIDLDAEIAANSPVDERIATDAADRPCA